MSNLSAFLRQNAVVQENVKVAVSKRFLKEDGKPMEWEIKTITAAEEESIRKACTKRVQLPGKRNQYTEQTDQDAYVRKLATACTVFPNLNDVDLQDSYEVMGADNLLTAMLLPGEYAELMTKIQEITGYDVTMEDKVDEAKN